MNIINKSKITKIINFNLKLIVLSSLLFSQRLLSEIFLYQNDPDTLSINIAKANTSDTWYNTSYLYRKEISINSAKVPNTDQTNFPALISLTDNALRTVANGGKVTNASGYDIIFANQAGNAKLDHEIESYDAVNGTIVMWVKMPALSHLTNTVFYIYYGNTNISTTQENKTGVWDSSYSGVYHLKENGVGGAGDFKDSTSNGKNSTNLSNQPTVTSSGKIGSAESFNGTDNYIALSGLSVSNTKVSVEFWMRWSGDDNKIPFSWNTWNYYTLALSGGYFGYDTGNDIGSVFGNLWGAPSTGLANNWTHIVAVFDHTGDAKLSSLYLNGAGQSLSQQFGTTTDANLSSNANIGGWPGYGGYFGGTLDEIRVSNAVRSADWIATEYNNQSDPTPASGSFILPLGTEEALATAYDLIAPSPSSGLVSSSSQNFTIAPTGIYTGTITITPSGGGLSAAITKTFTNSSNSQTFAITPTVAGTVTLTPTNSGGLSNPSPVTYTSISTSASPSSTVQGSTGNDITITGIGTSWTAGTPGVPTFTLSGGTGASITSQIVTDPTHATLTLNAGSIAGNLTITDPSTGATTTVSVVPSTSNLITSFNLTTPATTGIINDTTHTVSLTVPYGTNVTSLTPTITVSTNATISPASGISHNFTSPVTYTVTAQDGITTQDYTVTVNISPSTAVGFISPTQISIPIQSDRIDVSNLPSDIIQIAISRTPDFKDVSWEVFNNEEIKQLDNCPDKLYIKFRNKSGAVSDVIVYIPKANNGINISNLQDGDIVKTLNNPDVYIIKIKNNKKYKRLILSPQVFQSYGHLKWSNIKIISPEELNQYAISNLVKETMDTVVYELFSNGDTGEKRVFDDSKSYDSDSIYEINKTDRDLYRLVK